MNIRNLLAAGYPCLAICSQEPTRVPKSIMLGNAKTRNSEGTILEDGWDFFEWDCLTGIYDINSKELIDQASNPLGLCDWLNQQQDTVVIAHNLHFYLEGQQAIPEVIQAIENGAAIWKSRGNALVMLSPMFTNRPELEKIFHIIDYPLPDTEELYALQQDLLRGMEFAEAPAPSYEVAKAARGLTLFEAETAFARCLAETGKFDLNIIRDVKGQMIRKTGLMEYWEPEDIKRVGGLGGYKSWLEIISPAFLDPTSQLPQPKAVLLVGVAGGGKSLSSKATASVLGRPLIRFDINAAKGGIVGESEKNLRLVAKTLEAFGECVVWMDEIEKSLAGGANTASAASDAGTSVAMFGFWLTFMQETKAPILFIATANDVSALPSAFLRRFDEIFFTDLPTLDERKEIIQIMNIRYGSKLGDRHAELTKDYTGAEIEKVAKASLFYGPDAAVDRVAPVSKTNREELDSVRAWAISRGAQRANSPESKAPEPVRKVKIGG